MASTTPNRGYRYPQSTDSPPNISGDMQNLATDVDADVQSILAEFTPGTPWVPVLTASTNPTYTVNQANLFNIGKLVVADFFITFITAGSGNYILTTPFPTTGLTGSVLGAANIGSSSTRYERQLWENGGSSVAIGDGSANRVSSTSPVAVASGTQLSGFFCYFSA